MSGTIVLGIGNRLGGDDAAGALVVDILDQKGQRLNASVVNEVTATDAGTAPESYASVIRRQRPDVLIMVDAADMGLPPGAVRIVTPDRINTLSFSTHHMPLSMFIAYVNEFCGKVMLVGIQPERTETGTEISEVVRKSVSKLAETILKGQISEIPLLE
ncbi:MAG: hydrogenase maturation peptidase HycI [Dehalococcoidia bacterium]